MWRSQFSSPELVTAGEGDEIKPDTSPFWSTYGRKHQGIAAIIKSTRLISSDRLHADANALSQPLGVSLGLDVGITWECGNWSCPCQACVVAFSGTAPDRAAGDSESDAS
jgi:hypothetical protein